MRGKHLSQIIVVGLLFLLSSYARADVLYDNLSSTNDGIDDIVDFPSGNGPLADSFSTGATAFDLEDVQLLLLTLGPDVPGSYSVGLYSDSSTSPGSLLLPIGTLDNSAMSKSLSVYDFPLVAPYTLAPDTRYWLKVSAVIGAGGSWAWATDQNAIGVSGEFVFYDGGVHPNSVGPHQMKLTGTAAVPEPATMLLLGSGLVGLAGFRRKFAKE